MSFTAQIAAIQISFSGIGFPFCLRLSRMSAYFSATNELVSRTRQVFMKFLYFSSLAFDLPEFFAPKSSSPQTVTGRQTRSNMAIGAMISDFPFSKSIAMFVSRAILSIYHSPSVALNSFSIICFIALASALLIVPAK